MPLDWKHLGVSPDALVLGGAAELEPSKLARFLRRVEDGYNDTPYHCKAHAADVLQSMHTLLTLGGLASRMDDELIMLAGTCYTHSRPRTVALKQGNRPCKCMIASCCK